MKIFARLDTDRRARELREKDAIVTAKEKMAELSAARERTRVEILQAASGDLGRDEEEALKQSLQATKAKATSLVEETAAERRKLEVRSPSIKCGRRPAPPSRVRADAVGVRGGLPAHQGSDGRVGRD